jgi:hypothetical protein
MATLPGEKTQEDVAALRVDDGHLKLSVAPPPAPQEVQTEELLAQKPDVAEPQEVQPKEVQEELKLFNTPMLFSSNPIGNLSV